MILDKETYTRQELADMIGVAKKSISAWCSKSKMTLIPMSDNPDLIDMRIEKNLMFVQKKLKEKEIGRKITPFTGITSAEKKTILNTKKLSEPAREKRKYIKQKDKVKIDVIEKPTIKESKPIVLNPTPPIQASPVESEESKQIKKRQKDLAEEVNEFERRKRELTIVKLEEEVKRKQLERERIEGDYVKTEYVIKMFESATNKQGQIIKAVLDSEFQYIGIKENISSEVISRYKEKFLNKYNREIERMREEIDI
jgi:hypothetical protein